MLRDKDMKYYPELIRNVNARRQGNLRARRRLKCDVSLYVRM